MVERIVEHGIDKAGTRANRPSKAPHGFQYYDETERRVVTRDGVAGEWLEGGGAAEAIVTVTTAQILALNATPVALVAAPGANKALIFDGALIWLDYNSAAYAGIAAGEDLAVKYTDGSGLQVGSCEATSFLDLTADAIRWMNPYRAASGVSDITPVANAALVLQMLVGEVITGNSPLKIRTFYRVVRTAW